MRTVHILLCFLLQIFFQVSNNASSSCTVSVELPWTEITPVSLQSPNIIKLICVRPSPDDIFIWTRKGENEGQRQFHDDNNTLGFYLSNIENNTQFLTINKTMENNNTRFTCLPGSANRQSTTIIIYQPTLTVSDVSVQTVNITWSDIELHENYHPMEKYTLRVQSSNTSLSQIFPLNKIFYVFTSNEDNSSCAVFNFSVITSFTSDIHRGDCISESIAVQTMLPSLPNITLLERSLTYSLTKNVRSILLIVFFRSASSCSEIYRETGYMLGVTGPTGNVTFNSADNLTSTITITSNELEENVNYIFRIITFNIVGNASTSDREFFTTDVQMVTATAQNNKNTFVVQCDFITGSDAQGCMVVLVGEQQDNITAMLTKSDDCNNCTKLIITVNVTQNMHSNCYDKVFGFDIESDGSVGTLAVPGKIIRNVNVTCRTTGNSMNTPHPRIIIPAVIVPIIILLFLALALICSVLAYHFYKVKRNSLKQSITTTPINNEDEEDDDNMPGPVYDLPLKQTIEKKVENGRTVDDAEDHHYHITSHIDSEEKPDVNSSNNNNYAELNEETDTHHYFVLENNGGRPQKGSEDIAPDPDAPALPPPFKPEPPPVYQDINGMPYMQEESAENEYATVKK